MTVKTLTQAQLASELGYTDADGNPSERKIAEFMREALLRWGMCAKRALLEHAREQLRAGDLATDAVPRVLERLFILGECAEVWVGHEAYVIPTEPRWVLSGGGSAVLLGPVVAPPETPPLVTDNHSDVAVRVQVTTEEQAAALEARGARQITLAEWLHPFGYLRHVARRSGEAIRIDQFGLRKFWDLLVDLLSVEGLQIDVDAEVRAVGGQPGFFFGRQTAATLEGRWRDTMPDGVWCAYRRGYGEGNWLPTLVSIDGSNRRVLDLFDHDEWRWALFARSIAIGPEEVVRKSGEEVQVTWPLPTQVQTAMDIVSVPTGAWRWRRATNAPDIWSLFR